MKRQKKNKWEKRVAINLAHYRLQGDVYALSAEIDENKPLENSVKEEGIFERFFGMLATGVRNEVRKNVTVGLKEELEKATGALQAFEERHKKLLKYGADEVKFKKVIAKKLFKKDKYGLQKIRYALAFIVKDENEYCRADESLQVVSELLFDDPTTMPKMQEAFLENYRYLIAEKRGIEIETLIPTWAREMFGLLAAFSGFGEKRRDDEDESAGTENHFAAALAFELTTLWAGLKGLPEEKQKEELDEFLKRLGNYRADAEYRWLIEGSGRETSAAQLTVCNRTIARLSEILGV